jgi:hypothetical protein
MLDTFAHGIQERLFHGREVRLSLLGTFFEEIEHG